jgi:hypothetical protein
MPKFRACYDYGMGGVWLYVEAADALEVVERYPALEVFEDRPRWMSPEFDEKLLAAAGNAFWTRWLAELGNTPPVKFHKR